jgi:hypothetical protein
LADDALVQVRANSWREDQVSTDNCPVYKVVMAIDEGLTILELAFQDDLGKAPYKIWRDWDQSELYTDDERRKEQFEERRLELLTKDNFERREWHFGSRS